MCTLGPSMGAGPVSKTTALNLEPAHTLGKPAAKGHHFFQFQETKCQFSLGEMPNPFPEGIPLFLKKGKRFTYRNLFFIIYLLLLTFSIKMEL